jgi:serine/threonine protein kinase
MNDDPSKLIENIHISYLVTPIPGKEMVAVPEIKINQKGPRVELGEGKSSKVYKIGYGQQHVAIKEFFPDEDETFDDELFIHHRLNHPHIIALIGFVGSRIRPDQFGGALLLELAKQTLQDFLDENIFEQRTNEKCSGYARDLAQGIYYLHSKHVMHGDIKPCNALIMQDGKLKISDFGLSHQLSKKQPFVFKEQQEGSLQYMPPELFIYVSGQGIKYTPMIDIYTLGWVLYLLTTHEAKDPYDDIPSMKTITDNHRDNILPVIQQNMSPALRSLIYACWKKEPEERPDALLVLQIVGQKDIVFRPTK